MAEDVDSALVPQPLRASEALIQSALPLIGPYVAQAFSPDPRTASKNCLIVGQGGTERNCSNRTYPTPGFFAMHQGLALGQWFEKRKNWIV